MSNAYCTITQLGYFLDTRSTGQLGNDTNTTTADTTITQTALDTSASELESHLRGRVTLPLTTVPTVLTRWVAVKASEILYGRRGDLPKQVKAAIDWADQWVKDFDAGIVSIGADRLGPDRLQDDVEATDRQSDKLLDSVNPL